MESRGSRDRGVQIRGAAATDNGEQNAAYAKAKRQSNAWNQEGGL
jgi:hypothetical protein